MPSVPAPAFLQMAQPYHHAPEGPLSQALGEHGHHAGGQVHRLGARLAGREGPGDSSVECTQRRARGCAADTGTAALTTSAGCKIHQRMDHPGKTTAQSAPAAPPPPGPAVSRGPPSGKGRRCAPTPGAQGRAGTFECGAGRCSGGTRQPTSLLHTQEIHGAQMPRTKTAGATDD